MVADFITKSVPRSLVRVPGSGRGKGVAAPAVSCDLGRVSSFAASIIVNPHLPAIMTGPKSLVIPSTRKPSTNKLATTEVLASSSSRRALTLEADDDAGREHKRPRMDTTSPPTNSSSHSRVVRINIPPTQPQALPDNVSIAGKEGYALASSPSSRRLAVPRRTQGQRNDSSKSLEDLLQEQDRLRAVNRLLMLRLSYYLQLGQTRETQTLLPPPGPM